MERCPVCGAAVRPGAKFCTSCGSRLDDNPVPETPDTQQTIVAPTDEAAETTAEDTWKATPGENTPHVADDALTSQSASGDSAPERQDDDGSAHWSAQWPQPAVASEESPESDEDGADESDESDSESNHIWSWSASEETAASTWNTDAGESSTESATITPAVTSTAGASSDDETTAPTTEHAPASDPRQHATELLDQVRSLIWEIGTASRPGAGEKNAIQNIRRVRGETGEFADLATAIDTVRQNPRDVDALLALGQKADRLHDLLESHKRLVQTLEEAIRDE